MNSNSGGRLCALVLGGVPIVRAGIVSLIRGEWGAEARVVSADWMARERAVLAAPNPGLVVMQPDRDATVQQCSRLAAAWEGAVVVVVVPARATQPKAELPGVGVQLITLGAPLAAWRRAIQVVAARRGGGHAGALASAVGAGPLTERQLEVFEMLATGLSNKQIAERLGLTVGTVKLHVAAVLRALHARNRVDVVLRSTAALPTHRGSDFDAEADFVRVRTTVLRGDGRDD